jgi:predicted dehydrogenase
MNVQQIGVAMIGTGFMAQVHIEALRRVGVTLVGILGSSAERSRSAAQRFGLQRAFESWEQVLEDPAVHAVHLGVPNRLHLPMARAALHAGKHVLCEKPLAMNSTESAELVALAQRSPHLATGVNYNNRYYPLCIEAREAVAGGDLGRIFHVTGSVTQDWLLYETDYNWRVLREEQGDLRALADIGAHWMDLIHFITGLEIEALCADFATVHPVRQRPKGEVETFAGKQSALQETEPIPIHTDDYGAVLLRFRGGARGCFYVSQVSPGRKYRVAFEIAAQHRTLAWNSERCEEMWIGHRAEPNRTLLRDPALLSRAAGSGSDYPGGHNEGYPDTFKMCFRDFYRAIASGDLSPPSYPTFTDGHRDILLCEAIQRSYHTGGWVNVEEITP